MKRLLKISMVLLFAGFIFQSCNNDDDDKNIQETKASYEVRMTDNPALYDEVNIDLQQVNVHNEAEGWMELSTNAGMYNLLALSNGEDTVVAVGELPSGTVSQIRFVLGSNNNIVVNGTTFPLSVPSGSTSGLKLNLHQELEPGINYYVLIDFDASASIIQTGNGQYKLKPVLDVIAEGIDGAISGELEPAAYAQVYAIHEASSDTSGTFTNEEGYFLIQGLEAGEYTLNIDVEDPWMDMSFENVLVVEGEVYEFGEIQLNQ